MGMKSDRKCNYIDRECYCLNKKEKAHKIHETSGSKIPWAFTIGEIFIVSKLCMHLDLHANVE